MSSFWRRITRTKSFDANSSCPPAAAPRVQHSKNRFMAELFEVARRYYQSAASDPWRWADDGAVLVWADGSTIAFREEVFEILDGLASNGLPPFRLVVLILAACKGKFPHSSEGGPFLRERVRPAQLEFPPPV